MPEKKWMPLARVGQWIDMRGRPLVFGVTDFERIIGNYDPTREKAPLFLDLGYHTPRNGDAAGWVDDLRVNGDLLEAQIADSPPEVKADVAAGRRRYISGEFGIDSEGRPDQLLRVALLGAYRPAIKGMPPLEPAMFSDVPLELRMFSDGAPVLRTTMLFEEAFMPDEKTTTPTNQTQPAAPPPEPKEPEAKPAADAAQLQAKLAEAEAELAQAQARLAERDQDRQEIARLRGEMKTDKLRAFAEGLVREGKLPPGLAGDGLVQFMAGLSDQLGKGEQILNLSQGEGQEPKAVSPLEFFQGFLGQLSAIIQPGHRFIDPGEAAGQHPADKAGDLIARAGRPAAKEG